MGRLERGCDPTVIFANETFPKHFKLFVVPTCLGFSSVLFGFSPQQQRMSVVESFVQLFIKLGREKIGPKNSIVTSQTLVNSHKMKKHAHF